MIDTSTQFKKQQRTTKKVILIKSIPQTYQSSDSLPPSNHNQQKFTFKQNLNENNVDRNLQTNTITKQKYQIPLPESFPETRHEDHNQLQNQSSVNPNWNQIVLAHLMQIADTVITLSQRMNDLQQRMQELENSKNDKKKKFRRKAIEIEKLFKCLHPNCEKSYGSEISLNLHLKLKHSGVKPSKLKDKSKQHESQNKLDQRFKLHPSLVKSIEAEYAQSLKDLEPK